MFSLLINLSKYLIGGQSTTNESDLNDVISKIENAYLEEEYSNDSPLQEENNAEGCYYRDGIVTSVSPTFVIVDDGFICDNVNSFYKLHLKKGDKVHYLAYQRNETDKPIIRKIISVVTMWDDDKQDKDDLQIIKKNPMMSKSLVVKVMKRQGRNVIVEPGELVINLDNVSSSFVPYMGDWLKLESLVEFDENAGDLSGEVLEISKIEPLRSRLKIGYITKYDANARFGVIESDTVFNKLSLQPGYVPAVGDKVIADSIESEQGIYTWRCLSTVPLNQNTNSQPVESLSSNSFNIPPNELKQLTENKQGITITDDLTIDVDFNTRKDIDVKIENSGPMDQLLVKGIFMMKKSQSQLSLISPDINTPQRIKPGSSITYKFKCIPKFVGTSEELFFFSFHQFKIARLFKISVNTSKLPQPNQSTNVNSKYKSYHSNDRIARQDEHHSESYIPGIRPCKAPAFIAVRSGVFRIPQRLWDLILPAINNKKPDIEIEAYLTESYPYLEEQLTPKNYRDRFHMLLYLEEMNWRLDMQRYDMENAIMIPTGDFLVLEVPGLSEKRPSLIVGDRAVVEFNWDSSGKNLKYEGCIHKVKSSSVYLQFNPDFHELYNSEECQISFRSGYTQMSRCHNAVNLAVSHLGIPILFPSRLEQKEPQVDLKEFEIDAEELAKKTTFVLSDPHDSEIKKRKLVWFNKKLNYYQKEAVRNILYGVARPLPYVIFGPPGTGKTITLCETILQILTTIPESRILIASPSNSSANLIAERLLDSGVLKPGDLVRLIAHHCLNDNSIPERLLPYCATGSLADDHSRSEFVYSGDGPKINCTTKVLGRHRITIGTCVALGLLYNMGFPRGHFTHIVVDEAGQATEPEIMIPLTFTHCNHGQIILAGDPMQLGPTVGSKIADNFGLGQSFLVRLLQQFPYQKDLEAFVTGYDPRLVTKLIINYRSLPEILQLPNKLFYDSELQPFISESDSPEAKSLRSLADILPARKDPPAVIFHGVDGQNLQDDDSPSWYNPNEATQVYLYLSRLYELGLDKDEIGIITPYRKQISQIRSLLTELEVPLPKIGSVEEFQGQERKVIIVSTVRTSDDLIPEDIKHALGFIASPRRLNVAITRSRVLLIIIGNPFLLSHDFYWRSVLQYCISNESYTGCSFAQAELGSYNSEVED